MGLFSGCLLVSDIDGTLLCNGVIPERNLEAIEWFKNEGGLFTVATGRTVEAARFSYYTAKCNTPAIAFHGGAIYDFENEKFVYTTNLCNDAKEAFLKVFEKFTNAGFEIHCGIKTYVVRPSAGVKWHTEYESIPFINADLKDIYSIPWSKALIAVDTNAELIELEEFCESLHAPHCRYMRTLSSETTNFFELIPENVDKGRALLELAKMTGTEGNAYAIGDFYNDLELIAASDYGAATLEAPDDVKCVAKYISGSCESGAVADYIETIASLKGSIVWTK